MYKVPPSQRSRIDAPELEIFLLEAGSARLLTVAEVEGFRAEEYVEDELDCIGL
jgi:hypothetical protein